MTLFLLCRALVVLVGAAALLRPPPPTSPGLVRSMGRADAIASRAMDESLASVLPREKAGLVVRELRADSRGMEASRDLLDGLLVSLEQRLRREGRPLREVVGPQAAERLLRLAEEAEVYDAQAVRAFLQTGVVERMVGEIL